jgi:hypothetical protein
MNFLQSRILGKASLAISSKRVYKVCWVRTRRTLEQIPNIAGVMSNPQEKGHKINNKVNGEANIIINDLVTVLF